ncbi:helix-turn-helix transcriptional regulator [Actinocorallia aurea]
MVAHRRRAGLSQGGLAARLCLITGVTTLTRHEISRWERGARTPTAWLDALAHALGVKVGDLCEAPASATGSGLQSCQDTSDPWEQMSDVLRREFLAKAVALTALPPVLHALEVIGDGDPATIADGLGELVEHYAQALPSLPPAGVYDELVAIRSYGGSFLDRTKTNPRRVDLALQCGRLSGLLAIAAQNLGRHGAARLWCSDTERRSREAGQPELAGWSHLTRSVIAHYQRLPRQAADLASQGRRYAPLGTVAHARLSAQYMRATAMTGDGAATSKARRQAVAAMSALPADVPESGVYSITPSEDPPYTATSLLLTGHHHEAAGAARRVIQTTYHEESRHHHGNLPGYARALFILALAQVGAGDPGKAADTGLTALNTGHPTWPTLKLATQLADALTTAAPNTFTTAYVARYQDLTHSISSATEPGR